MKLTARNIHRDFAYFYVGLIISFSFSGIFLNHRQVWHPMKYQYAAKEISLPQPVAADQVDDAYLKEFSEEFGINDRLITAVDKGYNWGDMVAADRCSGRQCTQYCDQLCRDPDLFACLAQRCRDH